MAGEPERPVDRRHAVEHRDRLGERARLDPRHAQQHRRAHLLLEQRRAVGRQAVLVEGLAMVGDDEQHRALPQAAAAQPVDHLADVQVDVGERVVEAVQHHRNLVGRIGQEGGREVERRRGVRGREAVGDDVGVVGGLEVQVDREGAAGLAVDPVEEGPDRRRLEHLGLGPFAPPRRVRPVRRMAKQLEAGRLVERDHVAPALVLAGEDGGPVAEAVERVPEQRPRVGEITEVVVTRKLARVERGEDRSLRIVGVGRGRVGTIEHHRLARQLRQPRRRLRPRLRPVQPLPRNRLEHQDDDVPGLGGG